MAEPTWPTVPTCVEAGEPGKRPSLVFLHGIGGRAWGWRAQLDHFAAAGWHTLAWDMPGYGDSAPVRDMDFDHLAAALDALLADRGIERAVLVGHSMGGMVALQAWARHPSRVAGLVLAASSPAFGHGSGGFQTRFLADRLAPLEAGQTLADIAARLIPSMAGPDASPDGLALAQACMGSITPEGYRSALRALIRFEQRAALSTIAVPTLCLAGEHDRTAAPVVVRRMAERIPGAAYVEMPGAGHLMNFEQPEAFSAALSAFLEPHFPAETRP
ncbi:MAG: alpha/beta fold hydrolase [Burkholderiaceae bacterium]